jgi:hypothetical protein
MHLNGTLHGTSFSKCLYRPGSKSEKYTLTSNMSIMKDRGKNLPNIHTSLAVVKRLKLMDSGDIHLMGSFPLLAL